MTAMKGFGLTVQFPMFWGDMDALGHANNVRFFRWFETARVTYFQRLELPMEPGEGPILAHISCDYLKQLVFPADLIVGVRTEKIGRTSLTLEHVLARVEAPDEHIARGQAVVVLVNYATGEKIPVSDAVRAAVEAIDRA